MKRRSTNKRTAALTLVELLVVIIVLALIGAFVLLPRLTRPRARKAVRIHCVNNLKQVGLSFRLWSGDNNDKYPMRVSVTNGGAMESATIGIISPTFQLMSNELSTPRILVCPADTNRIVATNFTTEFNNSKISYFVGLDADESNPQMLLAGDRNLTTNGVTVRNRLLTLTTNSLAGWTSQIHSQQGDAALADGSVLQVTTPRLRELIANTGVTTNRLVLP